jgi:hypothetical protein
MKLSDGFGGFKNVIFERAAVFRDCFFVALLSLEHQEEHQNE